MTLAEAWELLLEGLPSEGVLRLSATEIKARTGLEPRLMAKFDHRDQLPPALRRRGLYLLPVRNGEYALIRGEGYHTLEPCPRPEDFPSRVEFSLRTLDQGLSESQFLDLAYNSGMLSRFTGVPSLYPTIRGRKRSPRFAFRAAGVDLEVEGVQVEVDAGYEGPSDVILLEAKIGDPADFHMRQLYYPFRFWSCLTEKRVRVVFFTYEDGVYRLREYRFDPPEVYRAPVLVKAAAYRLKARVGRLPAPTVSVPGALRVPQADDLEKVARLPFLIAEGCHEPDAVAAALGFTRRQSGYYSEACEMLGLLSCADGRYALTPVGQEYVSLEVEPRHELLCRLVLELPVMRRALTEMLLSPTRRLDQEGLEDLIRRHSPLSGSTVKRRAGTIRRWFAWLGDTLGFVHAPPRGVSVEMFVR